MGKAKRSGTIGSALTLPTSVVRLVTLPAGAGHCESGFDSWTSLLVPDRRFKVRLSSQVTEWKKDATAEGVVIPLRPVEARG